MLSKSDTDIASVMRALAKTGTVAGYLVPTVTGLGKSIMDAHSSFRTFLAEAQVHDFAKQAKGISGKVVFPIDFIHHDRTTKSRISLYRPETKDGDPRVWIYGLSDHVTAGNLIAVFVKKGSLYAFNASDQRIRNDINNPRSPLGSIIGSPEDNLDATARGLMEKLRMIAAMGFVPSVRNGSTGVGATLEHLLGIRANSSRAPDYYGIEIKASRTDRGAHRSRVNLFSQVPDWEISECRNGLEILARHGYIDESTGRLQLYTQLESRPNSLGLFLANEEAHGLLHSRRRKDTVVQDVVVWQYHTLLDRLKEKHNQTFWVHANRKRVSAGQERFHYYAVTRTSAPLTVNFATLVDIDAISFDFTLSKQGNRVRDHGYLFKIRAENLDLLFTKTGPMTL